MSESRQFPFGGDVPLDAVLYRGADPAAPLLVLAHGAGAGQRSGFMVEFAQALAARGVSVLTFDFPYMQHRRRMPDRGHVLRGAWRAVLVGAAAQRLLSPEGCAIGGKSMGGRIASEVLAESGDGLDEVRGLILLGYPLHPPGRPGQLRTAHLPQMATPVLVVQGGRDAFGGPEEVRNAFAAARGPVEVLGIEGADHSFKVPRTSGPQGTVDERIRDVVAHWVKALPPGRT
jgi:predicted alpha/beta-hydrolase family hydrolase